MDLLKTLCSVPTAPFAEGRVVEFVRQFVRGQRGLRLSEDEWGNLLIECAGTNRKANGSRLVFAAHMDHPGFVAGRMRDGKTLEAAFRGGVKAEYFKDTAVRFFDTSGEAVGRVSSFKVAKDGYPESATILVPQAVERGAVGMWDVGEGKYKGKLFQSRVCDNLAGAAGALAMIAEIVKRPAPSTVAVLLTRGEEEGFIGAIGAVQKPRLIRKSDRLIVIECSTMQPQAPQGKGPIIRVGDKTSVFNSALTYFITQQAAALAKSDKKFTYQRALMPGGTCEATVYDLYGYTAVSICVALGNYHNMDTTKKKIAAEYIDVRDWNGMVKLFVRIARKGHEFDPTNPILRTRLEKRFQKFRRYLLAR
jgi:endoglucanase